MLLPVPAAADPAAFAWLLPATLPIAVWVAWSDMARMRIPNQAVLALAAVWLALGWWPAGMTLWLWGFALLAIVLVVGFVANQAGLLGAGDAKFAAAMAPFFAGSDLRVVLALFAACLLAACAVHRIARAIPAVRRATPGWASWTHAKFPMGLALSGTLIFHPLLALIVP
jgi:prepilin peptidase CpaA